MDDAPANALRFSLSELLYAFVLAAGFFATLAYVGTTSQTFWWTTFWVALMVAIVAPCIAVRKQGRAIVAIIVICIVGNMFGALVSLALLSVAGLLLLLLLFSQYIRPLTLRRATFVALTMVVGAYAVAATSSAARVKWLASLKEQYPIVSIADRLDYEANVTNGRYVQTDSDAEPWQAETHAFRTRAYSLELLHSQTMERFVRAQGFGLGRMHARLFLSKVSLEYPAPTRLSFSYEEYREKLGRGGLPWELFDPNKTDQAEYHRFAAGDFLSKYSTGWPQRFRLVSGFNSHTFLSHPPKPTFDAHSHELLSLQLVSLRRFPKPKVYVLDHLPKMDELSSANAETRELNDFEVSALDELTQGKHVVFDKVGDQLLMLGALRATKDCLQCHSGKEQQLLGAFTYRFAHAVRPE